MSVVVIDSGPAGVAAAHALSDAGHRVTVLDAGDRIEAGRMEVFDTLAQSEPERWPAELARRARSSFPVGIRQVPLKSAYGSLFPYALHDSDLPVARERVETLPSLALGGLSNSWGASMLPFRQRDIEDWPIALADLEPHYEAVLRFVPIAAERDELAAIMPLYAHAPGTLRRGPQAEMLLRHLRRHATALRRAGFALGASRLAVVTSVEDPRHCRYSGMCLYGCPYRSIYNAAHTLESLIRRGGVDYRGGIYVDRLTEAADSVTVDSHARNLTASRVFVACGSVSSTRLVLESLGRPPSSSSLLDSQYFLVPMITGRAAAVSAAAQGNTLAQVFVELEDARISRHTIHLQLYGLNDLILSALSQRLPLRQARLERALRSVLGRLLVMQGYLHSADSPGIMLERRAQQIRLVGGDRADGVARVRRPPASHRHGRTPARHGPGARAPDRGSWQGQSPWRLVPDETAVRCVGDGHVGAPAKVEARASRRCLDLPLRTGHHGDALGDGQRAPDRSSRRRARALVAAGALQDCCRR